MAFTIPPLDIDVPMRLDGRGVPQFCKANEEAFYASFEIGISATAPDEWEVTEVTMGTQPLRGETRRRFAQYFETEHETKISDHVGENLPSIPKSRFLRQMMGA